MWGLPGKQSSMSLGLQVLVLVSYCWNLLRMEGREREGGRRRRENKRGMFDCVVNGGGLQDVYLVTLMRLQEHLLVRGSGMVLGLTGVDLISCCPE